MKSFRLRCFSLFATLAAMAIGAPLSDAQQKICINGICYDVAPNKPATVVTSGNRIDLMPLTPSDVAELDKSLEKSKQESATQKQSSMGDRFEQVVRATVRVTVSGVCGSGTIVGRDSGGRALVLTNAHVAGTARGRVVNVERWDANGRSQKSTAAIISSGYGRGVSLDFALLRAAEGFATDVAPIPLADRQPDTSTMITTYGCPRCEWPSMQVLRMNKADGQILRWAPEAIGGRSGSGVIDYQNGTPRLVGLLTWGGGGEGLGQSTPFILAAMRGQLPKAIESLPPGVSEVAAVEPTPPKLVRASWPEQPVEDGPPLDFTQKEKETDDIIGTITDRPKQPDAPIPDAPSPNAPAPNAPNVGPSDPSGKAPDAVPQVNPLTSPFRRALLQAAEAEFKADRLKRADLFKIRVATLSPRVLERLELTTKEQVITENKVELTIGPDQQMVANFDWSKLVPFLRELIPLVLEIIELIGRLS